MEKDRYNRLKEFLKYYFDVKIEEKNFRPGSFPPEDHPSFILEEFEKESMSKAKKGLEITINDVIEDINDWHPDKIKYFNEKLKSLGIITLTELRKDYSRKYKKVLKSGKISNEIEYYLLKNIADDVGLEISEDERAKVESIMAAYENSLLKKLGLS